MAQIVEKENFVRLVLSSRDHRLLRRVAADADLSMATYVRELLERHLEDESKRRGITL